MAEDYLHIPIKYDGGDATRKEIDLIELGQSLHGAGKLIRSAASVVIAQPKTVPSAQRIRVLARPPEPGSFIVDAVIVPLMPFLPFAVVGANKAVEQLVSYVISKYTRKDDATDRALELAQQSLSEMGMTSRAAVEAIARLVENQRPAVRQFVSPIGDSCETAQIGMSANGALSFDRSDREEIEAPDDITIGEEESYAILISELDLKNRTCKFQISGEHE